MKYFKELLQLGCFTWDDVCNLTGNPNTAGSLLKRHLAKGYVQSVKRNLYVTINLADGLPTVNQFVIASHITPGAYVSHHSAFSYHGYEHQVFYEIYVSSPTTFHNFDFGGFTYRYIKSRISEGVLEQDNGVSVTDVERTIIDSINDFEKIAGLEELLNCLSAIPYADESRLLSYLKSYNKQILYQKTGYILEHYKEDLKLSAYFFSECLAYIGKSVRYLYNAMPQDDITYNQHWQLFVPKNLLNMFTDGVDELV